ncbi:glycosyltransferase family 2 protein [Pedobacter cryotolerans]|uniref:Glycosyltransferase family 2 protein n=1 Tax=Pedobacter cryotolerans TaxID=2571270 RepID=A0A4U1C4M9_9SPHI|nr:glycosyltransferase family 2 protein [Pedobacter cryotolerans]TKB98221.1 glycosyltransferase family 2 protein [Pedobacter cryotolerans]
MNSNFSFVILTYNEEIHLPRLLKSIKDLNAAIYILDSGSTDHTLAIAKDFNAETKINPFENHPKQWDFALKNFNIKTPWIIGLDADQIVTTELYLMLQNFKNDDYLSINGIYFNRKNYFKGTWIKYGGFYPKYLLKMFRTGIGYSDLNENMDHRFIVNGETTIWKNGHLIEENLKENEISFWISKHNRYSDLIAQEEVDRFKNLRSQSNRADFFGNPDERNAYLKKVWWKLPLGFRPFLYFGYRLIFKLGVLDGSTGVLFHFLQGFWFRLIVDVKMKEIIKSKDVNL